jgi:hypothetical protein
VLEHPDKGLLRVWKDVKNAAVADLSSEAREVAVKEARAFDFHLLTTRQLIKEREQDALKVQDTVYLTNKD